jgi:hypothetical protein
MKKNDEFVKMAAWILIVAGIMIGCKDDEPVVNDPEGTIVLQLNKSGSSPGAMIENAFIYISWANDFCGVVAPGIPIVEFVNIGKVNGLGAITKIPEAGWRLAVPVEPQCGYVARVNGIYYRIYVVRFLYDGSEIYGAELKYQTPFEPTTLDVSNESLSFATNDSRAQTVYVTTDCIRWTYDCEAPWVRLSLDGQTLSVSVEENKATIERSAEILVRANEKLRRIVVKQDSVAQTSSPYAVGDIYYEKGVRGVVYKVSDKGMHGMLVSLDEGNYSWSHSTESPGCYDSSNGANNLKKIKQIAGWEALFPAFNFCNGMNTEGKSDWYLPAIDELKELYMGFSGLSEYKTEENATIIHREARDKFNATLIANGGDAMREFFTAEGWSVGTRHWSSTEAVFENPNLNECVWNVEFQTGWVNDNFPNNKIFPYYVRAVRAF